MRRAPVRCEASARVSAVAKPGLTARVPTARVRLDLLDNVGEHWRGLPATESSEVLCQVPSPTRACFTDTVKSLTANLRTRTLDFGGLDSSRILILRGGIFMSMSIGNCLESLTQAILARII